MPINTTQLRFKMSKNEIFDHKFLATVDRKWQPYREGKLPDLGMLDLKNENRGVIKDDSRKGSPCSIHYLRCIKFNLLAIVMFFPGDFHNYNNFVESYFDYNYPELERLHEHPELFSSKTTEQNFHYDVSIICDLLLNVGIPKADEVLESQKDVNRAMEQAANEILAPAKDERRKPWQQFLHNQAPGSGINARRFTHPFTTPGMKTNQAVPMTVAKVVMGFKEDRDAILEDLGIMDVPKPPPAFRLPNGFKQKVTKEGSLRTSWASRDCLPPIQSVAAARKVRERPIIFGPMSLEKLNENFAWFEDDDENSTTPPWPTASQRGCYMLEERPYPVGVSGSEDQQK